MAESTATVYHPDLDGITYEVPAGDKDRWKTQGWLLSAPKSKSDD